MDNRGSRSTQRKSSPRRERPEATGPERPGDRAAERARITERPADAYRHRASAGQADGIDRASTSPARMPTPQRRRVPGGWRGNLNFNARGQGEPARRGDAPGRSPRSGGPTQSRRARARPRPAAAGRRGGKRTPRRPTAAPSPVGPLAGGPPIGGHAGARAHTACRAGAEGPLWARARRSPGRAPRGSGGDRVGSPRRGSRSDGATEAREVG